MAKMKLAYEANNGYIADPPPGNASSSSGGGIGGSIGSHTAKPQSPARRLEKSKIPSSEGPNAKKSKSGGKDGGIDKFFKKSS